MPHLQPNNRQAQLPGDALAYSTVAARRAMGDIGRTKLYELIAAGHLRAMKCGNRTLICAESVRSYLANLPTVPAKAA